MGDVLGLTIAHFPYLRLKHYHLTGVLTGNMGRGWLDKPHLKDPANWPAAMRREWAGDQGAAVSKEAQDHEIEQFRKVRAALDEFGPDLIVIFYRDLGESFKMFARPPYWIHGHEQIDLQLFQIFGLRENYWEEDPDRVDTIKGAPEVARLLARDLQDAGLGPVLAPESMAPLGLGHNALATILHLDWDRREFKTPVLPIAIDPFGFLRVRNNEGMSEWRRDYPRPLLPREAFALGRQVARFFKARPERVALVAGTGWSHANDSGWEFERLHQDVEADLARFEEWRDSRFQDWGERFNFEDMERHAQWELLVTIVLAGAMTEIGAKVRYADLFARLILNSTWVTTIFEPK
jgi:hypothetical protein